MMYKVKIWANELKCEVCSENNWYMSTLKTELMKEDNALEYNQEVRYMFECTKCGNCKIFGMVTAENDTDEVNITVIPL